MITRNILNSDSTNIIIINTTLFLFFLLINFLDSTNFIFLFMVITLLVNNCILFSSIVLIILVIITEFFTLNIQLLISCCTPTIATGFIPTYLKVLRVLSLGLQSCRVSFLTNLLSLSYLTSRYLLLLLLLLLLCGLFLQIVIKCRSLHFLLPE